MTKRLNEARKRDIFLFRNLLNGGTSHGGYAPYKIYLFTGILILFLSSCQAFITKPTTPTDNIFLMRSNTRHLHTFTINNSLIHTRVKPTSKTISTAIPQRQRKTQLASTSKFIAGSAATRGIGSYFLVRILFLRGLGLVYLTAFLVALHQNKALIGYGGISPASNILNDADKRAKMKMERRQVWLLDRQKYKDAGSTNSATNKNWWTILKSTKVFIKFSQSKFVHPLINLWYKQDRMNRPLITLLWLIPPNQRNSKVVMNNSLDAIAILGIMLSSFMTLKGAANIPILMGLWLCQRSLMAIGGPWYGFGWEPQLAELTFHALFLVPLLSLNPIPPQTPVPKVVIWSMRWFLFRIMIGAGLIKLRSSDDKWDMKNLSTMNYFYETQPIPNPFSRMLHTMPSLWHKFEVLTNHFVELIAPWFLLIGGFLGRGWMIKAGLLQIIFQSVLIFSGNLSFLNWLTMLPAFFCLDDAFLSKLFFPKQTTAASLASYTFLVTTTPKLGRLFRNLTNLAFSLLIIKLSIPVVKNLCSSKQVMNASFDPLRLINSYGAFGTVNEERIELIVESANDVKGPWKEYEFKVKPGNIYRKPRWISPYHYRLDWQMWIASSCGGIDRSPWMYTFLHKLLEGDEGVRNLMQSDPWFDNDNDGESIQEGNISEDGDTKNKPKYIRVEKYLYKFNSERGKDQPYWTRERIGRFFPLQGIASMLTLKDYAQLS